MKFKHMAYIQQHKSTRDTKKLVILEELENLEQHRAKAICWYWFERHISISKPNLLATRHRNKLARIRNERK